jgi:peroxiredoxin Q/BCP
MKGWIIMCAALFGTSAAALQPGNPVPDLALPSTMEKPVKLTDYAGQWLVLYFYPRAFTPGCTAQSCSLRDEYGEITARGATILGVSLDPVERQLRFREEHQLPFHLLSDTDKALAKAFDSLMIGGLVAARKTFIIAPDSTLAYRFESAKTGSHAEEVIAVLDNLIADTPHNQ